MSDTKLSLQAGDCLLYAPKKTSVFGWIISFKTWHRVSHCETYIGHGLSVASRDGIGVGKYDLRETELAYVLRPKLTERFSLTRALIWMQRPDIVGQKYDWLGLLRFGWRSRVVPASKDNRMFCSEFLTRFYRAGLLDPFNGEDADAIAPFQFLTSAKFDVYEVVDGKLVERKPEAVETV